MKKLAPITFITLAFAITLIPFSVVSAASITVAWDANPANESAGLKGYTLRYWKETDLTTVYTKNIPPLTLTATVELSPGTWFLTVEAYNDVDKSAPSNTVTHTVTAYAPPVDSAPAKVEPPQPIGNLRKL